MRTIKKERGYFLGTHKDCEIEIERDHDFEDHKFYIRVRAQNGEGGHLYDGYSPEGVTTMAEAMAEARYGAQLDPRPSPQSSSPRPAERLLQVPGGTRKRPRQLSPTRPDSGARSSTRGGGGSGAAGEPG